MCREEKILDRKYLAAIIWACRRAVPRPALFCYTHAWREIGSKHRVALKRAGIEVFASVHGAAEEAEAHALGFRLAIDGGYMPAERPCVSDWIEKARGHMALVCPEQRLGHERITCSDCRYCYTPDKGDVVFFRHWPGAPNYRPGGTHKES